MLVIWVNITTKMVWHN